VSDKAECGSLAREQHGCNVVEASCHCATSSVCPGDLPPFTFASHTECEINLKNMLSEFLFNLNSIFYYTSYERLFNFRRRDFLLSVNLNY